MNETKQYGVCSVCGCTEKDACWHPDHGYCWWTDESHSICSHCAIDKIKDDPRTVHCMNTLRETIEKHVKWLKGPNLAKAILPLDANVGMGYEFIHNNERLKTSYTPRLKDGKRVLLFRINSFKGVSWDAIHYYCTVESYVNYDITDKPGWSRGIFDFPEGFPEDSKDMKFELVRELTQKEIDENPERWRSCEVGDKVIAFETKEEILKIIEKLKPAFGEGWSFRLE